MRVTSSNRSGLRNCVWPISAHIRIRRCMRNFGLAVIAVCPSHWSAKCLSCLRPSPIAASQAPLTGGFFPCVGNSPGNDRWICFEIAITSIARPLCHGLRKCLVHLDNVAQLECLARFRTSESCEALADERVFGDLHEPGDARTGFSSINWLHRVLAKARAWRRRGLNNLIRAGNP